MITFNEYVEDVFVEHYNCMGVDVEEARFQFTMINDFVEICEWLEMIGYNLYEFNNLPNNNRKLHHGHEYIVENDGTLTGYCMFCGEIKTVLDKDWNICKECDIIEDDDEIEDDLELDVEIDELLSEVADLIDDDILVDDDE